MKVYELKEKDKFKTSLRGGVWTVFKVSRNFRGERVVVAQNNKGTFRTFQPGNKTYHKNIFVGRDVVDRMITRE